MWPITLSGRLPIVGLVGRYLTNYLIGRELTSHRIAPLTPSSCDIVVSCGISTPFDVLSPCERQIVHALLTRPPLEHSRASSQMSPLDLHVLGTPPAFVLSQDQTLMFNPFIASPGSPGLAIKLIPIDCRSFLRSFSVSFSRSLAAPLKAPLGAPLETAYIEYHYRPPLSTPFLTFFAFFCINRT